MNNPEFQEYRKIPRLSRDCLITEKIDGTNGQIYIVENYPPEANFSIPVDYEGKIFQIYAGSRNRFLHRTADNFGFWAWAEANAAELVKLGPGRHFGEWYGHGIQRGYGLPKGERRFALFNVTRWLGSENFPECCETVPCLYEGPFETTAVDAALDDLRTFGSYAIEGFRNPEGIVVLHKPSGTLFKKTFDDEAKGAGK